MMKDFDTVKSQLKELAEVINAFKAEAVQLRIIDLVIGGAPLAAQLETTPPPLADPHPKPGKPRKRRFIPGLVWHITHRCHGREFLFKAAHWTESMAASSERSAEGVKAP